MRVVDLPTGPSAPTSEGEEEPDAAWRDWCQNSCCLPPHVTRIRGGDAEEEEEEKEQGARGSNVDGEVVQVRPIRDLLTVAAAAPAWPSFSGGDGTTTGAGAGAGLLFVLKIAGAVAEMGYPLREVGKVAGLVGANTRTVAVGNMNMSGEGGSDGRGLEEEVKVEEEEEQVRGMLARLLSHSRSGGGVGRQLVVNSNEPVLLLNIWGGGYSVSEIRGLMYQVVNQLHGEYGVKVVRVYAGEYLRGSTPVADGDGRGFSITILNVVNTEIGGPSMIQLLDRPCGAEGWKVGVSKEEWEACGWEVEGVVELGMRNWSSGVGAGGSVGVGSHVEAGKDVVESGYFEHVEGLDQESKKDMPGTELEEQQMTTDESGDSVSAVKLEVEKGVHAAEAKLQDVTIYEPADSVLAAGQDDDNPSKIANTRQGKQEPYDPTRQALSESEARRAETTEEGDIKNEEENVLESEEKEVMNREVGEVKDDNEHARTMTTDVDEPAASSEESFEMVDRERTLIDMVFSQGKSK